ncbi:hypothetical protein EDB92DRAFT_2102264 [Lactarius akahatsu]|uniref:Uncharacterized protein n=1 Tax=Lactarius akahatsu TaxID=416441 RepID=A0AAD4QFI9_9AGAM|nr:hypothetical protein EDB92DRAFT_2102264 [Lactarius akahatsu]
MIESSRPSKPVQFQFLSLDMALALASQPSPISCTEATTDDTAPILYQRCSEGKGVDCIVTPDRGTVSGGDDVRVSVSLMPGKTEHQIGPGILYHFQERPIGGGNQRSRVPRPINACINVTACVTGLRIHLQHLFLPNPMPTGDIRDILYPYCGPRKELMGSPIKKNLEKNPWKNHKNQKQF